MTITNDAPQNVAFEYESGADLRDWDTSQLLELFATLEGPGADELNGEYASGFPCDRDRDVRKWFADVGSGHWLGKAYLPNGDGGGEGHNLWRTNAGDGRNLRFAWEIAPSTVGEGHSLVMRYSAFKNRSGEMDLIDEVRRVRVGLYVGTYHTPVVVDPFTRSMRADGQRTETEVFLLAGPIASWQGPDDADLELHD